MKSAAYPQGCAHPGRCGSDGETCCHSDCMFSEQAQLRREDELLLRTMRVAQMQRGGLDETGKEKWLAWRLEMGFRAEEIFTQALRQVGGMVAT